MVGCTGASSTQLYAIVKLLAKLTNADFNIFYVKRGNL